MDAIIEFGILADDDDSDDDIDDVILLHIFDDENLLGNRALLYGEFNLQNLNNKQCVELFRFEKQDINPLRVALGLPEEIQTSGNVPLSGKMKGFFNDHNLYSYFLYD